MPQSLRRIIFSLFAGLSFLTSSCYKFEGGQTVPAYLHIEPFVFTTDFVTQGSNTHKITDAWVYVNDQLIGVYELPATIPVLQTSTQRLNISPGIKLNGISATRVPYPFYKPFNLTSFNFIPDSVQTIYPNTSYQDNLHFAWMEDFEGVSNSFEKTNSSDTTMMVTSPANNPEAWISPYSSFSGMVKLDTAHKLFQAASFFSYVLPGKGKPVFLELDYKCDHEFLVGLIAKTASNNLLLPLVVVNKSDTWNKIYINLGPNITEYNTAEYFKIFFEAALDTEDQASLYFDNIKLIYRDPGL